MHDFPQRLGASGREPLAGCSECPAGQTGHHRARGTRRSRKGRKRLPAVATVRFTARPTCPVPACSRPGTRPAKGAHAGRQPPDWHTSAILLQAAWHGRAPPGKGGGSQGGTWPLCATLSPPGTTEGKRGSRCGRGRGGEGEPPRRTSTPFSATNIPRPAPFLAREVLKPAVNRLIVKEHPGEHGAVSRQTNAVCLLAHLWDPDPAEVWGALDTTPAARPPHPCNPTWTPCPPAGVHPARVKGPQGQASLLC